MVTDGHVASTVGAGDAPCDPSIVSCGYLTGDFFLPLFCHVCWGAEEHPEMSIRVFVVLKSRPSTHPAGRTSDPLSVPTRSPKVFGHELTAPDAFSCMTNGTQKGVTWSVLRRNRLRSSANALALRERLLISFPPPPRTRRYLRLQGIC